MAVCPAVPRAALLQPCPTASPASAQQLLRAPACSVAPARCALGARQPKPNALFPLQDVLSSKNTTIEDLQFQLARVCKVSKGSGHAVQALGLASLRGKGTRSRPAELLHALQCWPGLRCSQFPNFPLQSEAGLGVPTMQGAVGTLARRGWAGVCAGRAERGAFLFQAHNDMLQTLEAKLTAFGIPLDNLGFKPLESPVLGQALGQGPAGLVAVPT